MTNSTVTAGAAPAPADERTSMKVSAQRGFFFWMSILLLSIVLIGFAPTF